MPEIEETVHIHTYVCCQLNEALEKLRYISSYQYLWYLLYSVYRVTDYHKDNIM